MCRLLRAYGFELGYTGDRYHFTCIKTAGNNHILAVGYCDHDFARFVGLTASDEDVLLTAYSGYCAGGDDYRVLSRLAFDYDLDIAARNDAWRCANAGTGKD